MMTKQETYGFSVVLKTCLKNMSVGKLNDCYDFKEKKHLKLHVCETAF